MKLGHSLIKKLYFFLQLALLIPAYAAAQAVIPAPPQLAAKSYLLQDFNSGMILAEHNADARMWPASLTKIMTTYVVFRELTQGNLKLEDKVTISEKAWRTGGSRMFVEVNKQVSVEELLKGIIIQSGNDATVALAEHIAGNEATFAQLMNQHAQRLGMENTHFVNSTGWPNPEHYTTARDLAKLTRALIQEFPDYYHWHAIKDFTFNGIKQYNRNRLLWRDKSVDGVKTGHTEEAGYCLVASALREDMRLISVVMGTSGEEARANENQALLNYGFRFFETHRLYKAAETLTEARIWKGEIAKLTLGLKDDLYVTVPRRHYDDLKATLDIDSTITAPVDQGSALGTLKVALGDQLITQKPLIALQSIPKGSFFQRLIDEVRLYFK